MNQQQPIATSINTLLNSMLQFVDLQQNVIIPGMYNLLRYFDKVALKTPRGIVFESFINIMYIKADSRICTFYLTNGKQLKVWLLFKDVCKLFEPYQTMFVVNRSIIINTIYMRGLNKKEQLVLLDSGETQFNCAIGNEGVKRLSKLNFK
jgi:DNA-binding LytR/AlgR family response regulator